MKCDIKEDYKVRQGIYDELFFEDNSPRKTTAGILDTLKKLGNDEVERRRKLLNYSQYYQAIIKSDNEENCGLDSIPLCFADEEWAVIEKGLAQRAKLYDLIAKDIYGEQNLIKDGIIPTFSVYANPNFLQMLWTGKNQEQSFVNLMSTDIVRRFDGKLIAVNDKFQIPEGLGNALENRISTARAYPELFHDLYVTRLRHFFENFRQTTLSGNTDSDGSTVLLASEPNRNRRSEDAILARYLKLHLVENDDLSVRGFKVYLKTLTGLQKVETILRRVEDGMCDPLELRIDSGEGAVGLISAVRNGNVKVVNSLGTSILESPIIRAFLPDIAAYFLKEDLILEPVKTFWLGDEKARNTVLAEPDKYMFYKSFNDKFAQIYGKMTMTAQLALVEKILKEPENYTAEEYVKTSTTPYIQNDKYLQGDAHFRFFASYTQNECSVMPGGLGWVTDENGKKTVDKDIWVLTGKNIKNLPERNRQNEYIPLTRAGGDLPSRAADNLFKLGKNLEKAEILARIARGISRHLSDDCFNDDEDQISSLFKALDGDFFVNNEYENNLWNFVMKKSEAEGLQAVFKEIRFIAVQLRDRISEDTWQFIKSFGENSLPDGKNAASMLPYLQRILSDAAAFEGLTSEGMTRGHGWRFLELGRRIERGILTLKMIKNMLENKTKDEVSVLSAFLEAGDGSLTYFRRYGAKLYPAPAVDLLLCDESNPHSVAYQAANIEKIVNELPKSVNHNFFKPLDKEILKLLSQLRLADVYSLMQDDNGKRKALIKYCSDRITEFENISELLSKEYLNHAPQKSVRAAMATEV
ncbi:MAG: circularly permuted type 2 ATP-grasp protein [Candidatus Gastranaerophilales bacterium]|nr:circularly permuted type 2 ATP-grasp protein [Candidatus Gastranaerophilales bacterium]